MEKIDLKMFRVANKLKQQDLAEYLQVNPSYLSQIESGLRPMSDSIIKKLTENPYHWDTTALTMHSPTVTTRVSGNGKANVQVGDNNVCADADLRLKVAVLEKENELLKEQIAFLKTLLQK